MVIPFPIVTSGLISVKKKIQRFLVVEAKFGSLIFNKVRAYSSKQTQYLSQNFC